MGVRVCGTKSDANLQISFVKRKANDPDLLNEKAIWVEFVRDRFMCLRENDAMRNFAAKSVLICILSQFASGCASRSQANPLADVQESNSARTGTPCVTQAHSGARQFMTDLHLSSVQVDVPVGFVCEQSDEITSSVDFVTAVGLATESLLRDGRHIESILALATMVAFEELGVPWQEPAPESVRVRADQLVAEHLSSEKTRVRMMPVGATAEDGEEVARNWIFRIKVPTLSDHIHWVIVDRSGQKPAYNYGFN